MAIASTGEGAAEGRATAAGRPRVTVVVPTFREAENLPHLVERLGAVRREAGLDLELLLMDDDSRDGTDELVRRMELPWVHLVVRTSDRGLSQAVLEGFRRSHGELLVVMDADLSHPPEKIPALLAALDQGAELAIGSRFAEGGSTDAAWGLFRWLNSRVAALLARPLTSLRDPMSGFFAIRRSAVAAADADLDPIGYKIGLELLVKCGCRDVAEVPIHFADRRRGESKLSLKEQLAYLRHLRRLYVHAFGTWSQLVQFLAVGASGWVVNLAVLTALLRWRLAKDPAVALAIAVSMVWNFVLNRRFTFSRARHGPFVAQLAGYVAACGVGALASYATTSLLWELFRMKQAAATLGVLAGAGFNFSASRFGVFREGRSRAGVLGGAHE